MIPDKAFHFEEVLFENSVFINCPFDKSYQHLFRAILYTIYRCGFFPVTALSEDNAMEYRLDKIMRLIETCRYGIHDISRTGLNEANLPRFNMPFELGLFFAAKKFGNEKQKTKIAIVLEHTKYLYQQYISDTNGIDTKAHENNPNLAIRHVRNWLATASSGLTTPGHSTITRQFNCFEMELSAMISSLGFIAIEEIPFNDYCILVEEHIRRLSKA